jgi:hypothetical protein
MNLFKLLAFFSRAIENFWEFEIPSPAKISAPRVMRESQIEE